MSYDPTPPLIPLDNAADLDRIQASFHTTLREILASKLAAAGLGGDGEAADPVERKAIEAELDQVRPTFSPPSLLFPPALVRSGER